MLTPEQNERLVRTDRGTEMGTLLRRYWIPALLAEEIPEPDCPPVRVTLMGEKGRVVARLSAAAVPRDGNRGGGRLNSTRR